MGKGLEDKKDEQQLSLSRAEQLRRGLMAAADPHMERRSNAELCSL